MRVFHSASGIFGDGSGNWAGEKHEHEHENGLDIPYGRPTIHRTSRTPPALGNMKAFLTYTLALLFLSPLSVFGAPEPTDAQKEAITEFPDLAKAGTPLNSKFIELYQQAKRTNSPVLSKLNWPLLLAREAAASFSNLKLSQDAVSGTHSSIQPTSGITMESLTLTVPNTMIEPPVFTSIPDSDKNLQDQKQHAHDPRRITLPGYIFHAGEGKLPLKAQASELPGVLQPFEKFCAAAKAGDLDSLTLCFEPKDRQKMDEFLKDPKKKEDFISQLQKQAFPVEVLLVLKMDQTQIVVSRDSSGDVSCDPYIQIGDDFYIENPDALPEDTRDLMGNIRRFLRNNTPDALLTK